MTPAACWRCAGIRHRRAHRPGPDRRTRGTIGDPEARQARYEELVAEHYSRGKAISTAAAFEIDDVIDPADTRAVLIDVLSRAGRGA